MNEFINDIFNEDNMNIIDRINYNMPNFSKTHKKIALYILNNYENVVFQTSSKLAKNCSVSESSIVRFANSIDYDGYTEMQKDLQNFVKEKLTVSQRLKSISKTNSDEVDILYDVLIKSKNDINWLMNNINEESFKSVVKLISEAENVYLIGSRSSYSVTYFLGFGLSWIRDNVHIIDSTNLNFDKLADINEKDVLLSVSLPRYLKSTIDIHKYGFSRNAKTICITDTISSPLVKYSTYPILINNEILSYSDNVIPVMCIVTGLLNAVAAVNEHSSDKIQHYEEFWDQIGIYEKF